MRGSPRGETKFESLFSVAKFLKAYLCLRLGMARKTIEDHLDVIVTTCPRDGRKSNFFLRTLNLTFLPNLLVLSHLIFRQKMIERRRIQTGMSIFKTIRAFVGQQVKCDNGRHGKHSFVSAFL